tara:strand:+ start:1030 stop:1680 length:651 start_codon:yes stop_codon:yes gene_type:complete
MTFQENTWSGKFGKEYNTRNDYTFDDLNDTYQGIFGHSRSDMNQAFLADLPRDIMILEVGCNFGGQLVQLQKMGFNNLYGLELQWDAIERAKKRTKEIHIIQGSGFNVPFLNNYFDLVFTSDVLIHISPDDIDKIMGEMVRVSNKYIWGFEYFNEEYIEVPYRNNQNLLWKGNYAGMFLDKNPELSIIKEEIYKRNSEDVKDKMYLLCCNASHTLI